MLKVNICSGERAVIFLITVVIHAYFPILQKVLNGNRLKNRIVEKSSKSVSKYSSSHRTVPTGNMRNSILTSFFVLHYVKLLHYFLPNQKIKHNNLHIQANYCKTRNPFNESTLTRSSSGHELNAKKRRSNTPVVYVSQSTIPVCHTLSEQSVFRQRSPTGSLCLLWKAMLIHPGSVITFPT